MFKKLLNRFKLGAHKIVKQSDEPRGVQDEISHILDYLSENQDELVTVSAVSKGSGVKMYRVPTVLQSLVQKKIIVKSETKPGRGTRYWINGGPNSDERV